VEEQREEPKEEDQFKRLNLNKDKRERYSRLYQRICKAIAKDPASVDLDALELPNFIAIHQTLKEKLMLDLERVQKQRRQELKDNPKPEQPAQEPAGSLLARQQPVEKSQSKRREGLLSL
jgi:hypothetical protein